MQFDRYPEKKQHQLIRVLSALIQKSPKLYFALPCRLQRHADLVDRVVSALGSSAQAFRLDGTVPSKRFAHCTYDGAERLRDHENYCRLILPAYRFGNGKCGLSLLNSDTIRTIAEYMGIPIGERLLYYRGTQPVVDYLRKESIWDEYHHCRVMRGFNPACNVNMNNNSGKEDTSEGGKGGPHSKRGGRVMLRDTDALLGRGTRANRHVGNNTMRLVVRFMQSQGYAGKTVHAREKRELATVLVNVLAAESETLFLTKKRGCSEVEVVERSKAIEKVMQCFRERRPCPSDKKAILLTLWQDPLATLVVKRTLQTLFPEDLPGLLQQEENESHCRAHEEARGGAGLNPTAANDPIGPKGSHGACDVPEISLLSTSVNETSTMSKNWNTKRSIATTRTTITTVKSCRSKNDKPSLLAPSCEVSTKKIDWCQEPHELTNEQVAPSNSPSAATASTLTGKPLARKRKDLVGSNISLHSRMMQARHNQEQEPQCPTGVAAPVVATCTANHDSIISGSCEGQSSPRKRRKTLFRTDGSDPTI